MNFCFQLLAVIEVIVINMLLFMQNGKRNYSLSLVILALSLFTLVLIPFGVVVIKSLGIYGNGNALFSLFGFFYLIPLYFLYEGSIADHFYIICFGWVYTLLVSVIAIQAGFLVDDTWRYGLILLIETLVFVVTLRAVLKFVKMIYMPLLQCKEEKVRSYLYRTSLVWYLTIISINLFFVFQNNVLLNIITLLIIALNILFNFQLIHEVLIRGATIGNLEYQVMKDVLTEIGNRTGFRARMEYELTQGDPFHVIYLDLNNFKQINDVYGHSVGDLYLKEFAAQLRAIAKNDAYRIAGDEFILLTKMKDIKLLTKQIEQISFLIQQEISFDGVSYGVSAFPQDGFNLRTLVDAADQKMYRMKMKMKKKEEVLDIKE